MSMPERSPGRPANRAIDEQLLRAAQDLLVEVGFDRLTMDAVAQRCGASKATIYRRWPSKTALAVAAAAALLTTAEVPDTGDLREDLLACGRSFIQHDARSAHVLASLLAASRHDLGLRDAARAALGAPHSALFATVMSRAAARGLISPDVDLDTLVEVFPAIAYQRAGALGLAVAERDVVRVVDAVLMPSLLRT